MQKQTQTFLQNKGLFPALAAGVLMIVPFVAPGFAARDYPSIRWKFEANDWVLSIAVAHDGTIFASRWTGEVIYSLNPDGTQKLKFPACLEVGGLTVSSDNALLAKCHDGIYAFGFDGTIKWKKPLLNWIALGDDGIAYAVGREPNPRGPNFYSPQENLYAVSGDGSLTLKFVAKASGFHLKTSGHGSHFIVSAQNAIIAMNADGTTEWSVAPGQEVSALAVGDDGVVYAGSHLPFQTHRDPSSGAIRPLLRPRAPVIYALASDTGRVMWSATVAKGNVTAIVVDDGVIYAGSYDGNIYALDRRDGALRWRFSTGEHGWGRSPVHALAIGPHGVLYAGAGRFVEAINLTKGE